MSMVKCLCGHDMLPVSPCPKCKCMTKSVRKSRALWLCGKCGADKTLSDIYFIEAIERPEKSVTNDLCPVCLEKLSIHIHGKPCKKEKAR